MSDPSSSGVLVDTHVCPQVDDPGGREWAMVVIEPSTPDSKGIWCDPCLVPLVKALNDGGLRTVASCCGHRVRDGSIIVIVDGQEWELLVRPFVPFASED